MSEQNRPADETGHQGGRYPTQGLPPQFPADRPGPVPPQQAHPQHVPPHQGWTGQQQSWAQAAHQPAQQQAYATAGAPGSGQLPPVFQPPQASLPVRRAGRWRLGVAGLVAGALIGGGAGAGVVSLVDGQSGTATPAAAAQNVVITDPQTATSATAAAAKAAPSVVTLYVTGSSGGGSGSGVVLTDDGYVLTNNHVVTLDSSTSSASVQVRTADGTLYDATVVGTDPTSDLAVVKLTDASGLVPATFANSDDVQVGDLAVAIGAPLGLSNTVTDGIVSATERAVATGSDTNRAVINAIQTDAAINPGNSGGALVDAAGEVIGINSAIASVATADIPGQQSGQSGNIGVGFAIPSNTAKRVADEIIANGTARYALLGVSAQTASENANVGEGAQVAQVTSGGPADQAGIEVGDVITAVGDRAITTSTELTAEVRSAAPGDQVTLTVRRGDSTSTLDVTLGTATS